MTKALTADGVDAERVLALDTVPKAKPGPGRGHVAEEVQEEKNRHDGGSFPPRTSQRLRAINRAPEAVKDAYREGRIGQALALARAAA
jgi:hypothetical protein